MSKAQDGQVLTDTQFNVQRVMETGQRIAIDHYNSVFHSSVQHPGKVFKIFYDTPESEVKENIAVTEKSLFPESNVTTADLSDYDFEENSTVVVQEKSDYSVLDAPENFHSIDRIYVDLVDTMDSITSKGLIHNSSGNLSELKLEEFHYYQGQLKYVDFEDENAFLKFPDDYTQDRGVEDARNDIFQNYQRLAHQAANEFGDDLDRIKRIFASESEIIESETSLTCPDDIMEYPFE